MRGSTTGGGQPGGQGIFEFIKKHKETRGACAIIVVAESLLDLCYVLENSPNSACTEGL